MQKCFVKASTVNIFSYTVKAPCRRSQPIRAPAPPPVPIFNPRPPDRPYGLQAIIDIIGEGIEIAFTRMSDGIVFIFDGFINLCKWIFRIDR